MNLRTVATTAELLVAVAASWGIAFFEYLLQGAVYFIFRV